MHHCIYDVLDSLGLEVREEEVILEGLLEALSSLVGLWNNFEVYNLIVERLSNDLFPSLRLFALVGAYAGVWRNKVVARYWNRLQIQFGHLALHILDGFQHLPN